MLKSFSTFSKKWVVKFLDSSGIGAISIPTALNLTTSSVTLLTKHDGVGYFDHDFTITVDRQGADVKPYKRRYN